MSNGSHTLRRIGRGARIADDSDVIADAVKAVSVTKGDRDKAKQYLLTWLLVCAAYENTTPSAVLDKLVRSSPPAQTQRQLVGRLQRALQDAEG